MNQLKEILLNQNLSLFERYRALFALRDRSDDSAVKTICLGLEDPKSALFRHEIAYVLGQLQHSAAVDSLTKVNSTPTKHNPAT